MLAKKKQLANKLPNWKLEKKGKGTKSTKSRPKQREKMQMQISKNFQVTHLSNQPDRSGLTSGNQVLTRSSGLPGFQGLGFVHNSCCLRIFMHCFKIIVFWIFYAYFDECSRHVFKWMFNECSSMFDRSCVSLSMCFCHANGMRSFVPAQKDPIHLRKTKWVILHPTEGCGW